MKSIGIIGLGAFGRLMVRHLAAYAEISAYDPSPEAAKFARRHNIKLTGIEDAAACRAVILAAPVSRMEEAVAAIAPHVRPGAVVLDVGSVKMLPVQIMAAGLPGAVDIIGTHPLFGPQSARNGIAGHKIVICPVRGRSVRRIARFLRDELRLEVVETTPEAHDRELAAVQGLTHMIARVLIEMEPLPQTLTTTSFDLIMKAVDYVRYDSEELFMAIERDNPYAADVRRKFFGLAEALRARLEAHEAENAGALKAPSASGPHPAKSREF